MEAVIFDAITRILGRVHVHVSLGSVEHVGDSDTLEIVDVADGVAVAEDDPVVHLVTVYPQMSSLVVVTGGLESWQWSVLSGSRVHNRVYQLVSSSLARNGWRLQSDISVFRKNFVLGTESHDSAMSAGSGGRWHGGSPSRSGGWGRGDGDASGGDGRRPPGHVRR